MLNTIEKIDMSTMLNQQKKIADLSNPLCNKLCIYFFEKSLHTHLE